MKYGFRFVTREDWGRLRGLFRARSVQAGRLACSAGSRSLVFAAFVAAAHDRERSSSRR